MSTTILNLLNDDETFTDANNCKIIAMTDHDLTRGSRESMTEIDAIEQALDSDDFSYVATFSVENGVLTIHINDASGVVVVVNDERMVESPSGWHYRAQQENGDNIDCYGCGNPLNDNAHTIVNDDEGFAYHEGCE